MEDRNIGSGQVVVYHPLTKGSTGCPKQLTQAGAKEKTAEIFLMNYMIPSFFFISFL